MGDNNNQRPWDKSQQQKGGQNQQGGKGQPQGRPDMGNKGQQQGGRPDMGNKGTNQQQGGRKPEERK